MNARSILRIAGGLALALVLSTAAQAQLFRAYLAIGGNDANPCTLPQPCRLLPAALNAVAPGGEIWLLDSANYNTATVNVTKSVNILAVPGAVGSVVATGGPAISIATAGVKVSLRNLVIVPLPGAGGTDGVVMSNGASLTVEQTLVSGITGVGIRVTTASTVKIVDTTIRGGHEGLRLQDGAGATVTRSVIGASGTGYAVNVWGTAAGTVTTAAIADSTLESGWVAAFAQSSDPTASVRLVVRGCQVDRNAYGLYAQSEAGGGVVLIASGNIVAHTAYEALAADGIGTMAWASGNTISNNGTGLAALNGGIFESAGDNAVRHNNVGKFGTITVVATE